MCNINAYSEAIKVFMKKDPALMAKTAGAEFDPESGVISLEYFGSLVLVFHPSGEIRTESQINVAKNDKVLILQYLITSCGVPPRNNWIAFIQLPDGPHHHVPLVNEAIVPLAAQFGDYPERFRQQAALLGAREIKMGDVGVVIPVFPHVPIAVTIWGGDDEFPASANLLYDSTAPLHLTTAALWVLGVEVSRKLRGVEGQQYSR